MLPVICLHYTHTVQYFFLFLSVTLWEGTEIKEAQWKQLNGKKGNVREFTNLLLRLMYSVETLASSSLTGKISNAFKTSKAAKPKLKDVDNIICK